MTSDTHNKYVYDAHINSTFIASYGDCEIKYYTKQTSLNLKVAIWYICVYLFHSTTG